MKLSSLHVQNFRALRDFKVHKLGRVNLIVGKNNSGKSTVLEAIRIYAGGASTDLLKDILLYHGETIDWQDQEKFHNIDEGSPAFHHLFTGRNFPERDEDLINIGEIGTGLESIRIEHVVFKETIEKNEDGSQITRRTRVSKNQSSLLSEIISDQHQQYIHILKGEEIIQIFSFSVEKLRRVRFFTGNENTLLHSCEHIPTDFISFDKLAKDWDKVTLSGQEEKITRALRFIEPKLQKVVFVEDYNYRAPTKRTAKVKIEGEKSFISIKSMGDGMLRVLQLALKMIAAKGGFLLVDEFENGLHYSTQTGVWRFVFALAEELDVQVFATTHSWDCVESFAQIAAQNEEIDGVLFRVGRSARASNKDEVIAVEYDRQELATLTAAHVELR